MGSFGAHATLTDLPEAIVEFIKRGCHFNPTMRFADAAALIDALNELKNHVDPSIQTPKHLKSLPAPSTTNLTWMHLHCFSTRSTGRTCPPEPGRPQRWAPTVRRPHSDTSRDQSACASETCARRSGAQHTFATGRAFETRSCGAYGQLWQRLAHGHS